MSVYATDEEYTAAKRELNNALTAVEMLPEAEAIKYLRTRLGKLNEEQVELVYGG